jgi:broad-specificity NMP kinase
MWRVLNTAKVLDELEDPSDLNVNAGGKIIEYHGCDFFPERFFQLVVVLRTDNTLLWDRLQQRSVMLCSLWWVWAFWTAPRVAQEL